MRTFITIGETSNNLNKIFMTASLDVQRRFLRALSDSIRFATYAFYYES